MEYAPLLAWFNPFAPIVTALTSVLTGIDDVTHNIGWSLVLLAALISLALWPLRHKQFQSAAAMQRVAPELKALQAKYKGDATTLNAKTMELYKERGVNPLASCLPMVLQLPILFSVYQAINGDRNRFSDAGFLWIGSDAAKNSWGHLLAASLVFPDYLLLAAYIVSMYFSFKLAAPPADPAQAQQQQLMAFISPAMIGYFAYTNKWPSALIVYWLSSNLFTMGQQFLSLRGRKNQPVTAPVVTVPAAKAAKGMRQPQLSAAKSGTNGSVTNGASAKGPGPKKPGSGTNAAAKRRR